MDAQGAATEVGGRDLQQRVLREREVAAPAGVGRVFAARGGHEHVERVVAARKKQADERLVIRRRGLRGEGVRQAQRKQRGQDGSALDAGATGLTEKLATGDRMRRAHFKIAKSGESATR
jgi:hypothetical protein